ncbi:anthranilate phosphoribosyltransferase [Candidatus Cyanaurora vandensis]|uniref:anthranilate phosphoribosyltransferase n=1 Tax=Candidatus Cyanaurora vandensis TaxID=2714958 RepID=UPI00257E3CEA|nr:anthranilate phosphoribosyltransferase [Candidatus Cyanaurora vandensis]
MNLPALLKQILNREHLSQEQAHQLMTVWLEGGVSEVMGAALLVALQAKGTEVGELTGFVRAVREASEDPLTVGTLVDTCGTGGSGTGSFNISTAVAFVGAACGVKVAKHGNRSASGVVGSADVLEYLGIDLNAPFARVRDAVEAVGVTFLYAPHWHPALKQVASVRRALGIRTIFNLIGPLANPLAPTAQVLGVYPGSLVETLATVLHNLGGEQALVLHGQEGLDEAGLGAPTTVVGFKADRFWRTEIQPQTLGLEPAPLAAITGASVRENGQILEAVLKGQGTRAQREVVALNASAVLQVGGLAPDWSTGVRLAQACLQSGAAWEKVTALSRFLTVH